jgi:CRP-like cAMP-binding protein
MPDAAVDLLRGVPLFSGLDARSLKQVAGAMRERRFAPGHEMTAEGEQGFGFFVIGEGEAEVTVAGERRDVLSAGDSFGELALVTGRERLATVKAKTDVLCFVLMGWEFQRIVRDNSDVAWQLLQSVARLLEDERRPR